MTSGDPVVRLRGVRKEYQALRPLRIAQFDLARTDTVGLLGFDRAAAEVLVNMITGATLPDEGDVVIFGGSTRDITTTDAWFGALDRFGILSERVVLLDELTVRQNLALPLSLDLEVMTPELSRLVDALCVEVRIPAEEADRPMGSAGLATKLRVRLGKALALKPHVILAEHPNASLPAEDVVRFGRDLASIAARRGIAMVILTADRAFAAAACRRVLTLSPATGELIPSATGWRRLFGG
jgi:ABC-type transporter Mla maintaining outer membrane lipid asymmetry ATPase subunit MlaF